MKEFIASFDKQVSTKQLRALRDAVNGAAQLTMPDPCTVHVTPGKGAKQHIIKHDIAKAAQKLGLDISYHRLTGNECVSKTRVSTPPKKATKDEQQLVGFEKADKVLNGFMDTLAFTIATHQKRVTTLKADLDNIGVKYGRSAAYALTDDGQAVNPVALLNDVLRQVTVAKDKLLHDAENWWAEEMTLGQLNRLRKAADDAVGNTKFVLTDLYTKLQRAQRTTHRDLLLRCLDEDVKRYSPLDAAFAKVYEQALHKTLDEIDGMDYTEANVLEKTADQVEKQWPMVRKAVTAALDARK